MKREALRRHNSNSPAAKWKPLARAGGEGSALVGYDELEKAFMTWTEVWVSQIRLDSSRLTLRPYS